MCPWPRLQGAISDPEALTVNYRDYQGEPRGSPKKAAELRAKGEPAGNCVDCLQCVTVCPIGIDIREGPNFACINCGLCGDACDGVMTKLGRPRGLIDYEAWTNIERGHRKEPPRRRVVRPKTITIDLSIAALVGLMGICLSMRSDAKITVIHDRNPVAVRLSDRRIRNGYTVRLYNKADGERDSRLEVTQLREASVEVIGDDTTMSVAPDTTRELRVLVSASPMSDRPSRSPRRTEISEQAVSVSCRVEDPFIPMAECDAVILVRYRKQKELREFNARMAAYDR
jgi:cytochrome c oxidase accessory protein FixG